MIFVNISARTSKITTSYGVKPNQVSGESSENETKIKKSSTILVFRQVEYLGDRALVCVPSANKDGLSDCLLCRFRE